jgi:hypothetical protein
MATSYRAGDYLYTSQAALASDDDHYDFITFLAVAQVYQIEFLPIRWQSRRDDIGSGGTSRVTQALMNSRTSLAFKCVRENRKDDEENAFRAMTREIMLLCHPCVRQHPYVAQLQGVCWDIPHDGSDSSAPCCVSNYEYGAKIWPVLVFEKSHHNDLWQYTMSPLGRKLDFKARLRLCVQIGDAISSMHGNGELKAQLHM